MQAVGRWMRRSCACYLTLVLGQKWANWHKLNSQVCKYVQSVTSMSRWGSTQTSAQWNTTTMTRVRVSLKTQFCHFLFSKASVFVPFLWNDNETSNNLVFECAGSQYTVDQEKDEETDGRKRYLSTYIYVYISIFIYCKGITEKDPKAYIPTSNPKMSSCVLLFFLLLPILAPVSC